MLRWAVLAFGSSFFPTWRSISLLGVDGGEPPARAQGQVGQAPPKLHPVPTGLPREGGAWTEGRARLLARGLVLLSSSLTVRLGIRLPLPEGQCPGSVTGGHSPMCTAPRLLSSLSFATSGHLERLEIP